MELGITCRTVIQNAMHWAERRSLISAERPAMNILHSRSGESGWRPTRLRAADFHF
jgi:hypothetical protein